MIERRRSLPPPADVAPDERPPRRSSSPPPTPEQLRSPAPALPVAGPRREGELLGGVYRVGEPIGRGATAVVYQGEHEVLGRNVALKVMTSDRVRNPEARRRFWQEAQAAASLAHANICRIYDLGILPDGALFCAMEFLQGEALLTRLEREGALPLRDALEVTIQVLSGLSAAHRKGIIHRDIKPENVFLARVPGVSRPVVKLLDFGLAKIKVPLETDGEDEDEITQITRTGVVVGTPFYMAPEAVTGQRDIDARVDLWAAGVVLYLVLTGKLPFRGSGWAQTAQAILNQEPASLSELRPELPEALRAVVARALAKRREQRYSSASEFNADLMKIHRESVTR